jgi:uncharacterized protein (DUF433 family)
MATPPPKGVIHVKTIQLQQEPGLPDGQSVTVTIQRLEEIPAAPTPEELPGVESWIDHLVFDSSVLPGERIVKGTHVAAETLVTELEQGKSDEELIQAHPELTREDVQALRHYAQAPAGLRRSFGAWAEDAEEVDRFIEWTYQQRREERRPLEP